MSDAELLPTPESRATARARAQARPARGSAASEAGRSSVAPSVVAGTFAVSPPSEGPALAGGSPTLAGTSGSAGQGGHRAPAAGAGQGAVAAQPAGAPAAPAGNCPTNYTVATHIVIDVEWDGSLALMGGTGQVHVWTKSQFSRAVDGIHVLSRSCGSALPEIKLSLLGGGYSVLPEIPDATWDVPAMPAFAGVATREPAGGLQITPGVALVGLSMADPLGAWPSAGAIVGVDHDADGNLGITAVPRVGGGFMAPPTSLSQTTRVDKLFLAIRTVMSLHSDSEGCPELDAGDAQVTMFDNHIIGCHVAGGSDCSAAERDFVDGNRTIYTILAAHYTSKRVPDTATCADVRAGSPK